MTDNKWLLNIGAFTFYEVASMASTKGLTGDSPMRALDEAIEIAGGAAELARMIGFSRQAVGHLKAKGRIGWHSARLIEEATGVSRSRLAPKIYGD